MDKPDISKITTLYTGLKDKVYSQMHENMELCHKMYNLDFAEKIEVPAGFQVYIPPTAYWLVQTGANQLITDSPVVKVESVSDSEKGQQSADIVKQFAEFLLKQMESQNEASPLKECAMNLCTMGMAVLKGPLFDANSWKTVEPKATESNEDFNARKKIADLEKRNQFPIYFRAIDPRTFYPDPSGRRRFAIERYSRLAIDIKNNWDAWGGYDANNPFQEIAWMEYWSDEYRSYLADDKAVMAEDVIKNVFNFLPYTWGFSGWGKTSPDGKPEDKAIGLLNPIISALEEESRFKSAMGNHFRQNVYQSYAVDPSIQGDIKFGPGEINQNVPVRNGVIEGIALFPVARINPDTYPILSSVMTDIQNSSASALLSGTSPQGDVSGYLRGLEIGQGRIKYRAPLRTLENMAANAIKQALYLIKHVIQQPVPFAAGKFITPDDIMEPVIVTVSLQPQDPAENDRKIKLGLELEAKEIISKRTCREDYAGRSDVQESQQILIEKIKQMPQYQALLLGQALEQYEMKALLEKLKAAEASDVLQAAIPLTGRVTGEQGPMAGGQIPGQNAARIVEQQRLGPSGGTAPLGSQPELGIVNSGIAGARGELPTKRGMVAQ